MIIYDLDRSCAERYLQWFDRVHIPEKLARPGYSWAAHYQVIADRDDSDSRYIAMFGANDSRTFYNPSPAQIKPRQPPETRAMMACRSNSEMLILSEEWTFDGACASPGLEPRIAAATINLALFNADENDETVGAWLVQDYLAGPGKSGVTRKFLASTGTVRHALVHERSEPQIPENSMAEASFSDWSPPVSNCLSYPAGTPMVARRVWPEGD
jgi:hypothetical protein